MTIAPTDTFRIETEDLLHQLEQALLDLSGRPGDCDLIATIFRALHTIKGAAAVFSLDALSGFTHRVESVFNQIRNGEIAATQALIRATLAAKDHMRSLANGETPATDGDAILSALTETTTGAAPAAVAARSPTRTYRIRFTLPENAFAMGTDPAALVSELLALGQGSAVGDCPPLAELDETTYRRDWEVSLTTDRPVSDIEDVFLFISDGTKLTVEPVRPDPAPTAKPTKFIESVVKVGADRIDGLIDQVGELVIAEARLREITQGRDDPSLMQVAEEIERLTAGLRETAMGIRMVPIGALFSRFRRPVHDLAHELGKEVRLITVGEETELDKAMVENLHDPLLHLVRNAVDHGIEDSQTRLAAGKPAAGTVTLRAAHVGAEVLISVEDDGQGLDRQRILTKAVSLGLLAPDATPPNTELFDIIFHPGFSTAATLSSISGRGVGMDVVKTSIESLRGIIDIASRPGRGTTITLRLPLTLAIIDGLLVRVAGQRYVIPMSMVEECVEAPKAGSRADSNFLTLRDELVPFLRLRDVFAAEGPPPSTEKVVVVGVAERRVGLAVDRLLGGHQTVVKSLSRLHRGVRCFSGATILGDGRTALILDVLNLIALRQAQEEAARDGKGTDNVN